ncbi:MAG: HAD-IIB family hydrolase, partial [Agathobacter sp.]|nr:HAD-IIB family hydrolase [Agathobacter sp.]
MGNIKIVFFDVDGTLLKFQTTQLSEKTVETLHRLQANGIKICVATGRPPVALPKFNEVDFDAFLTFNGSYCYTREGDVIFNNPISKEDVNIILRNAKRLGKPVSIAVKSRMTSNGTSEDLEQYYTFASQ